MTELKLSTKRDTRLMYLYKTILIVGIGVFLVFFPVGLGMRELPPSSHYLEIAKLLTAVAYLTGLLTIVIGIPLASIKRLHDLNLSGWWSLGLLILSLLPIPLCSLLFCIPGNKDENRFGKPVDQIPSAYRKMLIVGVIFIVIGVLCLLRLWI